MKTVKRYLGVALLLVALSLSLLSAAAQNAAVLPDRGWLSGGLAWSPDSTQLAIGSSLGVWIYAVDTWKDVLFRGDQTYIDSLDWSPDGREIATSSNGIIDIWDTTTGALFMTLDTGIPNRASMLSWSPCGTLLASANWDGTVRLWNTTNGDIAHVLEIPLDESVSVTPWSVDWSPDGDRLIVNGITIWDVKTGAMLREWTKVDKTSLVTWQPNGDWIATSTYDGHIEIRDVPDGNIVIRLAGHPVIVTALAWHPYGEQLASIGGVDYTFEGPGSPSSQVKIWDVTTGEMITELAKGVTTGDSMFYQYALAWSPDGRWLASTSDDGTVHLWDTTSWELVRVDGRFYSLVHTDDYISPTQIPVAPSNSN